MNEADDLRPIRALLAEDHTRQLDLLRDATLLCTNGSFLSAAKVFAAFRMTQEQHALREEALLARLRASGKCPELLASRALAEHQQLRTLMDASWTAMCRNEVEASTLALTRLSVCVDDHERGERDELLPALVAALPGNKAVARAVRQLVER